MSGIARLRVGWAVALVSIVACELPGQARKPCAKIESDIDRAASLRKSGKYTQARTIYADVLARADDEICRFQAARAYHGLGVLATIESRLFESLDLFDQAEETLGTMTSEKAGQLSMRIELGRGEAYFRLGWLGDADDALGRGLELLHRFDGSPRDFASALLNSARVKRRRGELTEAEDSVRRALRQVPAKGYATARSALLEERAWIEIEDRNLDAAEKDLDRAVEALEELEEENEIAKANLIADYAELAIRRRRWVEGLEWADKALALAARSDSPRDADLNLEANVRFLRSLSLWKRGDVEESIRVADSGLAVLEATRDAWHDLGIYFFAARHRYYQHRLDLAAIAEGPESAWDVFEAYRSQGLLESTSQRAGKPAGVADPDAREKIGEQRTRLLEAIRDLELLDSAADPEAIKDHEARFLSHRTELRKLQTRIAEPNALSPEVEAAAARQMLDSETLALIFAGGTERIHVLALDRRSGISGVTLDPDRTTLESKTSVLLADLDPRASASRSPDFENTVDELSRALLGPLADRLAESRRLVVVADGALERLPFGLLRHPRTGQRLIESHEIAYLPSFSVLAALRRRRASCSPMPSGFFGVGDPIFGPRDSRWPETVGDPPRSRDEALAFRRLPASAAEVTDVGALYEEDASVALGLLATRERFLAEAPRHRVIHVASHARSDSEVPERSKIALSCVDSRGRVPEICDLYFDEVSSLRLCGQLIVLSACETAGGQPVAGEGILGLPRAFLHAGASTVVASLWQVADEPAAELMTSFHRHLREGAEPAAALRLAKLEQIAAGRPPSVWSAFVLLGDWMDDPSSTFSSPSGPTERTD